MIASILCAVGNLDIICVTNGQHVGIEVKRRAVGVRSLEGVPAKLEEAGVGVSQTPWRQRVDSSVLNIHNISRRALVANAIKDAGLNVN